MDKDIQILAKTIYGEAKNQNISVMEAIANTILNRVRLSQNGINTWWGNNIREVCLKPAQFQCWERPSETPEINSSDDAIYQICHRIAVRAVKGLLKDNTHGGLYYHDINDHPKWAYAGVPCAQIGSLLFYDII